MFHFHSTKEHKENILSLEVLGKWENFEGCGLFLCSGFRVSLLIEQLSKKKLWTAKFWGVEDAVLEM